VNQTKTDIIQNGNENIICLFPIHTYKFIIRMKNILLSVYSRFRNTCKHYCMYMCACGLSHVDIVTPMTCCLQQKMKAKLTNR